MLMVVGFPPLLRGRYPVAIHGNGDRMIAGGERGDYVLRLVR